MQGLVAQVAALLRRVDVRLDDAWAAQVDALEARLTDSWAAKLDTLESRLSAAIAARIDADISSRAEATLFNATRASNIDSAKDNTATLVGRLTSARADLLDNLSSVAANVVWVTSSSNWTVPTDVDRLWLTIVGGGGGGASGDNNSGGAGGVIWRMPMYVSPGDVIACSIGAAGGTSGNDGTNGGTTMAQINGFIPYFAYGGEGADYGFTNSGSDFAPNRNGTVSSYVNAAYVMECSLASDDNGSGNGASTPVGAGGVGGGDATGYGAGGAANQGDGAPGVVIIEY